MCLDCGRKPEYPETTTRARSMQTLLTKKRHFLSFIWFCIGQEQLSKHNINAVWPNSLPPPHPPPALALCNLPQATCSIHCLVLCGPQKDELTDDGDCKGAVGLISRAVRSKVCDGFLANGEKLWKTIDWLRLDHHLEEWETTKCEEEESQTAFKAGSWKLNKLEEIYFCAN